MGTKHLATFYRPQKFSDLKGQQHIKKVLSLSSKQGVIGKAYLFSGTRGVGKTSVARIFAKAINCRTSPTEEPCNKCDICVEITKGISLDVMEIDGASHTGVDNVRKLIEDISLAPVKCKYRVVIIDEVHMLSRSAFNALLKTLEEPPPHVVFILATTEVHKIPTTIISRCQHFTFKKLSTPELVEHLKEILDREDVAYEEEALILLAKKGEGSVRDCLSMLSQLVAIRGEKITSSLVRNVLGIAPSESKLKLIKAIARKDIISIVSEVKFLLEQGIDIPYFLQEFAYLWRDLFLIKSGSKNIQAHLGPTNNLEVLKEVEKDFSIAQVHGAWQMVLEAISNLDRAQDPVIFLELLFINLAYLPHLLPVSEVKTSPSPLKETGTEANINKKEKSHQSIPDIPDIEKKDINHTKPQETTWSGFLDFLKKKNTGIPHIGVCIGKLKENVIEIRCPGLWLSSLRSSPEKYELLCELIKEYFGEVKIEFKKSTKTSAATKENLMDRVKKDPVIDTILKEFDGKIIDVSLRNL